MPLLALQMEEGSHKSRVWGPLDAGNNSVYSQQENLDLGLQLQGAEFLSINPNEQEMDSSLQPPAKNTACQNIDFSLVRPWQTSDLQNYVTRNLCYFKPQKGIIMQNICLKVNKEKINNQMAYLDTSQQKVARFTINILECTQPH